MDPKATIIQSLEMSRGMLKKYLEDISEDELFMRPVKNANHVAWQLGHLLASEYKMISGVAQHARPNLPEGFIEKHAKSATGSDTPGDFFPMKTYVELIDTVRDATLQELKDMDPEKLGEKPPAGVPDMVPTIGALFQMCASHVFMHAGQIAVLRRKLNKPIVI